MTKPIMVGRGVPIIGIADISAGDMLIFSVSRQSVQIAKEADTSADIALTKLIFI